MTPGNENLTTTLARGAVAGLAGTAAMTAFQLGIEMPLTGRAESYAPADLVGRLSPAAPRGKRQRRLLNYGAHFGVGLGWGMGHAALARRGLRGQRAVGVAFAVLWTGDVIANTALGLDKPWRWSLQDLAIDVIDKLVLAEVTGLAFDRLPAPA